jgi:hypothetical protein
MDGNLIITNIYIYIDDDDLGKSNAITEKTKATTKLKRPK